MTVLLLAPVVLSLVLLAAHFLRAGQHVLVLLALAGIPLLAIRRRWAMRVVQAGLVLGAIEWVRTLLVLARRRLALGEPWGRLAVILGAVALLTALSALLFQTRRLRNRYSR